jgi:hypothetical protein
VRAAASCFAEFFDPSRLAIIGAIVPPADVRPLLHDMLGFVPPEPGCSGRSGSGNRAS